MEQAKELIEELRIKDKKKKTKKNNNYFFNLFLSFQET